MDDAVRDLVASLRDAEDIDPQWELIATWARRGQAEQLKDTALALLDAAYTEPSDFIRGRILRLLALTPGLDFALALRDITRSMGEVPRLASRAAAGQPLDVCADLVASRETGDEEFLACLVQEALLRIDFLRRDSLERDLAHVPEGDLGDVDREPFLEFWRVIRSHRHPLGWLPLRLTTVETSFELHSYTLHGEDHGRPDGLGDEDARDRVDPHVPPLERETTTQPDGALIASAVDTWGGEVEARVFALRPGATRVPLAPALEDANLRCLGGGGSSRLWRWLRSTRAASIAPSFAFEVAFDAAAFGGAYDEGNYGAYGRLKASQTLGALAGAQPDEPFERVAELVERSHWYGFESDSKWFRDALFSVGLVAVSPDETRLAVLAATDTD
jgi:hypothetical protein